MKNILVIYYSQTGQLKEIISNFLTSWTACHIDCVEIKSDEFSFPMSYKQFFAAFPESALQLPCKIQYEISEKEYDCIILGFQPWFLHPSIPFQSFMQTDDFRRIVRNKPVILVMDARNSWRNCLNEVIAETEKNGGTIRGIYVFRDTAKNHAGFIALCYWLFTGRKKSPFKRLPAGGVDREIIDCANVYGGDALKAMRDVKCVYTVIPHVDEEFTSIKYEQYAVNKYAKWAVFIGKDNFKYRRVKMFLFRLWILYTFFVLSPIVSKRSKKTTEY
ncbi:MAG: hypothetical protein LBS55_11095 [Prevotellaceae bacterium]|jgi:hypothetical protein|nr:hypothetical protein [Prevotellaceae bacterium]